VQNGDRQMCGSAKAKQTYPLAGFHSSYAKAAETNDASAKQWRGVQIVHCLRKRKNEVGMGHGVFSVTTIDCVAGKSWRIAEIFQSVIAIPAAAVDTANPGNTNSRS